jgi:hypothetical protein
MRKKLTPKMFRALAKADFKYMLDLIEHKTMINLWYDEETKNYIMKNSYYNCYYYYNIETNEKTIYFPAFGEFSEKEMFDFEVPFTWSEVLYKIPDYRYSLYYKIPSTDLKI